MNLMVITPTRGLPSLTATIASVVDALEDDDRLVVVCDTINGNPVCARAIVSDFQPANIDYLECGVPGSRFGNGQRDRGLGFAAGKASHVTYLDDDDEWTFGAADAIRQAADAMPHAAHIFRMTFGPGHHAHGRTLWDDPEVREQNIGTPMVVVPNGDLPSWMTWNHRNYVSDFGWISAALEGREIAWHERINAVVRPR